MWAALSAVGPDAALDSRRLQDLLMQYSYLLMALYVCVSMLVFRRFPDYSKLLTDFAKFSLSFYGITQVLQVHLDSRFCAC